MARRKRSKSRRKSAVVRKSTRRSSAPKGFMQSMNAKAITYALMGAGVAAVADTMPQVNKPAAGIPGGASTVTAAAFLAASMITKKPGTKKMLQSMAMGSVGFAVLDFYKSKDGPWDVRQLMPGDSTESKTSAYTALPRQTVAASSVQSLINRSYVN